MNNALIDIGAPILLAYLISCVIAAMVFARRSQRAVRRRVQRTGQVSAAYAFGYLAWSAVKAWAWPAVLLFWLSRDRPEPGTLRRPTRQDAVHV